MLSLFFEMSFLNLELIPLGPEELSLNLQLIILLDQLIRVPNHLVEEINLIVD